MGSGYAKKKKEAKLFEKQFQEFEEQLQKKEVSGQAGNGLVSLTLNGKYELVDLEINPECIDKDDPECLIDLIKEAHKKAVLTIEKEKKDLTPLNIF